MDSIIHSLIDEVAYGRLDLSIDIHNKGAKRLVVASRKKFKGNVALKEIEALQRKGEGRLVLQIDVRNGEVVNTLVFGEQIIDLTMTKSQSKI